VNLVNAQGRGKGIRLKNLPSPADRLLLCRGQAIKLPPEGFRGPIPVLQRPPAGGSSRNALSISTCLPSAISFMP
jgi:hypothetical protein